MMPARQFARRPAGMRRAARFSNEPFHARRASAGHNTINAEPTRALTAQGIGVRDQDLGISMPYSYTLFLHTSFVHALG